MRLGPSRAGRWSAHPVQAALTRGLIFIAPIAASIAFVHFASKLVPPPTSSLAVFLLWWLGITLAATAVLVAIDRIARRLLPLAALLKLSLVFPDQAPSRFKTALRSRSLDSLEGRAAKARRASESATPSEAAERLLELVAALNAHDHVTRGHSERVRAYAVMIGEELGLGRQELDLLNWAALLHDVGKLSVPAEILNKDGRPTEAEWEVLRRHPLFGETLVKPLRSWLGTWADAVGYHHERWDGAGYPRAVAGDDIPLPGRIVAIADVFDVITSSRSYKSASGAVEGRKEISRCAGTQFDPRVVRAFLNCSLGRMRFVMGPLSWLAHAPLLGRLPLMPLAGTLTGSLGVIAASSAGGLVVVPAAPAAIAHHTSVVATAPLHETSSAAGYRNAAELVRLVAPGADRAPVGGTRRPAAPTPPLPAPPTTVEAPPAAPMPAPTVSAVDDAAVVPEGRAVTVDVLANDSSSSGAPLTLGGVDPPDRGEATAAGDQVRYSAADGYHGHASFTYRAIDARDDVTGSATVRVTILPVDHPPAFSAGGDQVVHEDDGPQTVHGFATGVFPGPADESAQHVSFELANDNEALFSAAPAVAADGTLTYTPAPDANGVAHVTITAVDDGGTANGGSDRSASQAFSVFVAPVNDPPTFVAGADQAVLVNAGPQTSSGWATQVRSGPPDEHAQSVTFTATNDDPSLFAVQPAIAPDGTLTYAPSANTVGVAHVSVVAADDGGTANGGRDTSAPQTFTIRVSLLNHAPSFTAGADQTVLEDGGTQSVPAWATQISPGPPGESGQTVSFSVANDDNALFVDQPVVAADGTLTYRTAPNVNGVAHLTLRAADDGGTAGGGSDTSAPQTFTITITPVNDAPSYTAGSDQTVLEDAGAQSVTGWATQISSGPTDEAAQSVTFSASNDDNALFSVQPSVAADGTLTYTPAANANGAAHVSIRAVDNGGGANGGNDTSAPQTLTISVTAVNDRPSFTAGASQTVVEGAGTQTVSPWATGISPGPADESGQQVSFTVTDNNATLFEPGGEPVIAADGSLSYTPAVDAYGTANLTVTISDDGGTANAGLDTGAAPQTFTVTVTPEPPVAAADAYTTTTGATLTVGAAQGVLANDSDANASPLTTGTVVSGPGHGSVSLAASGSFTYTPNLLFAGTDSFTYRVDDGLGLSATATATITVSLLSQGSTTLYLGAGLAAADTWPLDTAAPAFVSPVPDYDADGNPGLTIKSSGGQESEVDGRKYQRWFYQPPLLPLVLNGPVTLDLYSGTAGSNQSFETGRETDVYVYLYDCDVAFISCTKLAQNHVHYDDWNTTPTFTEHQITVGSVSQTILPTRVLAVKILIGEHSAWIAMTSTFPSALDVTVP